MSKKILTIEKLENLYEKTEDEFTKKLINDLKKNLKSGKNKPHLDLYSERILDLLEQEGKSKEITKLNNKKYDNVSYKLSIRKESGKKREHLLKGEILLSIFSRMIQEEFDLEPMHLHEFEIGNYKYGPECDEWREIFDSLDNIKLGAAISIANLKEGSTFKFVYDFGTENRFRIKILEEIKG